MPEGGVEVDSLSVSFQGLAVDHLHMVVVQLENLELRDRASHHSMIDKVFMGPDPSLCLHLQAMTSRGSGPDTCVNHICWL
jgi:hypothetical protein